MAGCELYESLSAHLWRRTPKLYGFFILNTSFMKNKNVFNNNENLNPKEFLTILEKLKSIPDYQNLGFTLKSLCKITQTALLADLSFPEYTEHNKWDIYNILQLLRSLIPEDELELLDKLNS